MGMLKEELEQIRHQIYKYGEGEDYMSDMANWVCVHVTKYEPKPNKDGNLAIKTTAMATDYELPRATVHVTLNQVVSNNMGGNWDEAGIIILAPYNDIVEKNSNPQEVAVEDTYFIPNPDTGLVLPETTYIIRPGLDPKSDKLFEITEHGISYKSEGYTQEEIEEILSFNDYKKERYEKYLRGDFFEGEIKSILGYDEKLIKYYENAPDKKAFMSGVLQEERLSILNSILRNEVVKIGLAEMGYCYVSAHEDKVSGKVAKVAREAGLQGNSGNKGHSCSLEHDLDMVGCRLASMSQIFKDKDIETITDYLEESWVPFSQEIISSIISDTPIPDVYPVFAKVFEERCDQIKSSYEIWHQDEDSATKEAFMKAQDELKKKGIKAYNPFLDTTLHRHAKRITLEINQALSELKREDPKDYERLKKHLAEYSRTEEIKERELLTVDDLFSNNTDENILEDSLMEYMNTPVKKWLKKTKDDYADILDARQKIKTLQTSSEQTSQSSEEEIANAIGIIKRRRQRLEQAYKQINPKLAQLREEEKDKIKNGQDPKSAQKERRQAVRAYYQAKLKEQGR